MQPYKLDEKWTIDLLGETVPLAEGRPVVVLPEMCRAEVERLRGMDNPPSPDVESVYAWVLAHRCQILYSEPIPENLDADAP